MKKILTFLLLLSSFSLFAQTIHYVKPGGFDTNLGHTWLTAFRTLQKALSVAESGSQIWVAKGYYYPDEGPGHANNDCFSSFVMKAGVAIYGGFDGDESSLSQRDWKNDVTVLSGYIDQGRQSYHVVKSTSLDSTARLDGFTITG